MHEVSSKDPVFFSDKLNSSGIRYEIALSIGNARIVWIYGGWPCVSSSDVRIIRSGLKDQLEPCVFIIGDLGHTDVKCTSPPSNDHPMHSTIANFSSRYETVNKRLKQFSELSQNFRHELFLHSVCFYAVVNITYLLLEKDPLFEVEILYREKSLIPLYTKETHYSSFPTASGVENSLGTKDSSRLYSVLTHYSFFSGTASGYRIQLCTNIDFIDRESVLLDRAARF